MNNQHVSFSDESSTMSSLSQPHTSHMSQVPSAYALPFPPSDASSTKGLIISNHSSLSPPPSSTVAAAVSDGRLSSKLSSDTLDGSEVGGRMLMNSSISPFVLHNIFKTSQDNDMQRDIGNDAPFIDASGKRVCYNYSLCSDIKPTGNSQVRIKLKYLEGHHHHKNPGTDPLVIGSLSQSFKKSDSFFVDENLTELYISAQLFSHGEPINVIKIITTRSNEEIVQVPSTSHIEKQELSIQYPRSVWEEWIVFPINYCDLGGDAKIALTILTAGSIPLGGTIVPLFDNSILRSGVYEVFVTPSGEAANGSSLEPLKDKKPRKSILNSSFYDSNSSSASSMDNLSISGSASNRDPLIRRNNVGVSLSWLDRLAHKRLNEKHWERRIAEAQKRYYSGGVDENHIYLTVEFPSFEYPILHEEVAYTESPVPAAIPIGRRWNHEDSALVVSDPEVQYHGSSNDYENPVETKYNKLRRSLLRGMVDKNLKPSVIERRQIQDILSSPNKLKSEHQNLLWKFRYSLVGDKKALTKVISCVDWSDDQEATQMGELLSQWQAIDVADALKLLCGEPQFKQAVVRMHAISTLDHAPDEELLLYLLQLVQALRYDDVFTESSQKSAKDTTEASFAAKQPRVGKQHTVGPLGQFLIRRALKNEELASYLHWYLSAEVDVDSVSGKVFSAVYAEFLEHIFQGQYKSIGHSIRTQAEMVHKIMALGKEIIKFGGKATARTERLRNRLRLPGNGLDIRWPVPLPICPSVQAVGINAESAVVIGSATYPLVIELQMKGNNNNNSNNSNNSGQSSTTSSISATSHSLASASSSDSHNIATTALEGNESTLLDDASQVNKGDSQNQHNLSSVGIMFKDGDDLRQDQLIMQMIGIMDKLFKDVNLNLHLTHYRVIATGASQGLVEFVRNSTKIGKVADIPKFFQENRPPGTTYEEVIDRFVKSCAGYCVITYILGIGDRHLENILLLPTGQMFHIDFGWAFGNDPKPFTSPMRITKEMIIGMGGRDSPGFRKFRGYCCQAYKVLRSHANLILNLLGLMVDAGIPDLSIRQDPHKVLKEVQDKFHLELNDERADASLLLLIDQSIEAMGPALMEIFHNFASNNR